MDSRQDLIKKNDYQRGWRSFLFERLLRHVVSREELEWMRSSKGKASLKKGVGWLTDVLKVKWGDFDGRWALLITTPHLLQELQVP